MEEQRPFEVLSDVLSQFHDFLAQGSDVLVVVMVELVGEDQLIAILDQAKSVFHWLYEQIVMIQRNLAELESLYVVFEIVSNFLASLIDILNSATPSDPALPLSNLNTVFANFSDLIPDEFDPEEWLQKLNSIPYDSEIETIKVNIIQLGGSAGLDPVSLPAGMEEVTGKIEHLIHSINHPPI